MSLRLGDIAPNFQARTSTGEIDFYDYLGNSWGILFSHPADYTPVCTTELGKTAALKDEFAKRNVKELALIVVTAVSTEDAVKKFPKGVKVVKPYLRYTPQPNK